MSTLIPSEVRQPFAGHIAASGDTERLPRQAALIPRSAYDDGNHHGQTNISPGASSTLGRQGYRKLNIDIPLTSQSSLSMEVTHDGKVTELVARFESYGGCSDVLEVSHDNVCAANSSTVCSPPSDAGTVRVSPEEEFYLGVNHSTREAADQDQHSPRKPIPSHWLPKTNGPSLATAERARERSRKKDSQSGSPVEIKTLRGARSSIELSKPHVTEGSTFLTKEALATVESNITFTHSARSPTKLHRSPSKPTWHSPTTPPLRGSPREQATLRLKGSPTRTNHMGAQSGPSDHVRAPSSIATSTGGNSFYTAEGSPVRSRSTSESSFVSAAEMLDETIIPHFNLITDDADEQAAHMPQTTVVPTREHIAETTRSLTRPRLALKIPRSNMSVNDDRKSTGHTSSAVSSSTASQSPWSPVSPQQTSRIPRVSHANRSESARSATQSSISKRSKFVNSLTAKAPQAQISDPQGVSPFNTPTDPSHRHVRTVNSSGVTPIISRTSTIEYAPCSRSVDNSADVETMPPACQYKDDEEPADLLSEALLTDKSDLATASSACSPPESSRATSVATIKPTQDHEDRVLVDSAIIYSRKKTDVLGTTAESLFPLIVMLAHNIGIGTVHQHKAAEEAPATTSDDASSVVQIVSANRGRTDGYVPNVRKQADSEDSLRSSQSSDLRATAPEFTPGIDPKSISDGAAGDSHQPDRGTNLPVEVSALDEPGMSWLYYMYPLQCAYAQGYQNGRSKSPRKFKPRKQRSSLSSPVDAQQLLQNQALSPGMSSPATAAVSHTPQRRPSAELMPPPPVPAHRQQSGMEQRHTHALPAQQADVTSNSINVSVPFVAQLDVITEQTALRERHHNNISRFANMDLTTIRNVGLPHGPRNMHVPSYYTVAHRAYRPYSRHVGNGLYGARGYAGIPMHATVPFPDPVAPQGRPSRHDQTQAVIPDPYVGYAIGNESCGRADTMTAVERGGGEACNTCAPDH
jgi:hypothetical protein